MSAPGVATIAHSPRQHAMPTPTATDRPAPPRRAAFAHFTDIATRWADNDAYRHVNNVVYYAWFDSAVNRHLIDGGALDLERSDTIGLVVETGCRYFSPVTFPDRVAIGLRVAHLGNSSVSYVLGVFRNDDDVAAAEGRFVHVYVDRASQRPVPLPARVRALLAPLLRSAS
jgi:acyl-CoA thioester hydrolase